MLTIAILASAAAGIGATVAAARLSERARDIITGQGRGGPGFPPR